MLYFLNIEVNPIKRSICKKGKNLKTSSLNFDLLVYFLKNPNQIISREELKQHVWAGRVVSDATVYKQLKRLKQEVLTKISSDELLQTVHGKGVVFVAEVSTEAQSEIDITLDSKDSTKNKLVEIPFIVWLLLFTFLVFVVVIIFQVKSINQDNSQLSKKIERLAILYQNKDGNHEKSLNTQVLAQALRAQMNISHNLKVNLEKHQSNTFEFNKTSTKLIQKLGYNYVLDIQVSSHESGVKAHVLLRKGREIYPVQKFEASSHYLLLKDITTWTLSKIQNINPQKVLASVITTSEEAFEIYLEAMRANFENKSDKAIKLLKQAINKDPKFSSALNALAGKLLEQGKIKEAIKLIDKIDLSEASYRLLLSVKNNLAGCYFRLGQVNTAIDILKDILLSAIELEDSDSIGVILINQSLMHLSIGKLDTAQQRLEQALFYIDESYQKTNLATIYLHLATIYFFNFETDKALSYSNLSYETYILAGNQSAAHMALSKWAIILLSNAEFEKSYDMATKVIENSSNKSEVLPKVYALQTVIKIDMEEAKFKQARSKLDIYKKQLTTIENTEVISEYLKLEYLYAKLNNDLVAMTTYINKLLQLARTVEDKSVKSKYAILNIDYILRTEKSLINDSRILSLTKHINDKALLWYVKARIYAHNNAIEKALKFFEKALAQFEKQNQKFRLIKSIEKYLQFVKSNDIVSGKVEYWQSILIEVPHHSR